MLSRFGRQAHDLLVELLDASETEGYRECKTVINITMHFVSVWIVDLVQATAWYR